MKQIICTLMGICSSAICYFFGGFDFALQCLCIFMVLDLITGVIVAVIFHNSPKNENGKLESKQFLKGLFRKIAILILVGMSHLLDIVLNVDFIRTAVIFAFMANEAISLVENVALMGVPIPKPVINALELLENKENENTDTA